MFNKVKQSMRTVMELLKLNSNWEKEIDHKYLDTLDSIESNMTVNELKQKRNERNIWTDSLNSKFKTSQKELNVL